MNAIHQKVTDWLSSSVCRKPVPACRILLSKIFTHAQRASPGQSTNVIIIIRPTIDGEGGRRIEAREKQPNDSNSNGIKNNNHRTASMQLARLQRAADRIRAPKIVQWSVLKMYFGTKAAAWENTVGHTYLDVAEISSSANFLIYRSKTHKMRWPRIGFENY